LGRFEPFADTATVGASWQIPKLLPAREPHCLRKIIANHTSFADSLVRPRPDARRVCPPYRRTIAAAGSGRTRTPLLHRKLDQESNSGHHFFLFCHPKKAVQPASVDRPRRKSL
jgi:hypothetical protein